nr:MAG TPA: putative periplasmic lipoprotein [Caudoviricetes sp.]
MKKFLDCIYRIFGRLAAIGSDKYLHFVAGLIVAMIACKGLRSIDAWLMLSLVPAFFVMAGKETVDYYLRGEQFDWKDVAAGMVGAIVGVILCLL